MWAVGCSIGAVVVLHPWVTDMGRSLGLATAAAQQRDGWFWSCTRRILPAWGERCVCVCVLQITL